MTRFDLSELQAQAILDMRLARLAALERKKIEDEYLAVIQEIAELEDILANPPRVLQIIKDELTELKRKYAGERRTRVEDGESRELTDEDLIADEDVVITISQRGYIKRQPVGHVPPPAPRRQGHHRPRHPRGGRGRAPPRREHARLGAVLHEPRPRLLGEGPRDPGRLAPGQGPADHQHAGRPGRGGRGPDGHDHAAGFAAGSYLVLATRRGIIKKTPLEQFERVRSTGIRAITLDDKDELAWVDVSTGEDDVIIATAQGMLAKFHENEVRAMGRDAGGVIGIRLLKKEGDEVVAMSVVQPGADLLVLSETGYGKRVGIDEFRIKHRGGQGVRLISLEGRKTGVVAAVQQVTELDEELVLISAQGQVVRTELDTVNRYSANARGVIVMRLNEGDRVVGIAAFRPGLAEGRDTDDNGGPDAGPGDGAPTVGGAS